MDKLNSESRAAASILSSIREIILVDNLPTVEPSSISNVSDIVGKTFGFQRVFDTEVHHQIYSILLGQLNLHLNKYLNTQGVCCSTLGALGRRLV